LNPKSIMAVRRDKRKRFFLVSVLLSNEPGALSQASKVLAIRDLNILEGYSCTVNHERQGVWSFIAESNSTRMDAKFIGDLLRESPLVEGVEIEESHNGLVIDTLNFPVIWGDGARAVVLNANFMRQAFELAEGVAGEAATQFIYQLGVSYGRARWNAVFADAIGTLEENIREATKLLSATGMARGELVSFVLEPPSVEISMQDCFEVVGEDPARASCNFTAGTIAGAASEAFKEELRGEEVECVSKGDNRCLVVVTRPQPG